MHQEFHSCDLVGPIKRSNEGCYETTFGNRKQATRLQVRAESHGGPWANLCNRDLCWKCVTKIACNLVADGCYDVTPCHEPREEPLGERAPATSWRVYCEHDFDTAVKGLIQQGRQESVPVSVSMQYVWTMST